MQISNIDELTRRLMPLTVFRRRAGEVLAKLQEVGELVITKDGRPVAKLSSLSEEKHDKRNVEEDIREIRKLSGGFHFGKITPLQINRIIEKSYENLLSGQ